jgi:nucleoside-diphosphate-sugar epimerase
MMIDPILVTGSEGLIGRALCRKLRASGHDVRGFDNRASGAERGDLLDPATLGRRLRGVRGIIHLAAMSRVKDGQSAPELCEATNFHATRWIAERAPDLGARWMLFGSSREAYGDVRSGLIREDAPLRPMNVYGRAKVDAETAVRRASNAGFHGAVMRFSSVFGGANDYATRVTPLFLAQAAAGATLKVEGAGHTFDFTFLDEVVNGLARLVEHLDAGHRPDPIHFTTGRGTTLWDLASMAIAVTGAQGRLIETPSRTYDMCHFVGDPTRAEAVLGWKHAADPLDRFLAVTHARQSSSWAGRAPAPCHPASFTRAPVGRATA